MVLRILLVLSYYICMVLFDGYKPIYYKHMQSATFS